MEEIILSVSKVPEVYMGYGQKQVQSDWNATNTTDPAYIKNKPTGMATETYVDNAVKDNESSITQINGDIADINLQLFETAKSRDVLSKNNDEEYTPTEPYHPATKDYVDDKVESDVLTKTNENEYIPTGDYNPATKKYVDAGLDYKADANVVYLKFSSLDVEIAKKADKTYVDEQISDVNNALDYKANSAGVYERFDYTDVAIAKKADKTYVDEQVGDIETQLKDYVDTQLGVIENGTY